MSSTSNSNQTKSFHIALKTDRIYCGDSARAIVSTILFLRLFGSLSPSTGEAIGVTYPIITNGDFENIVGEKVKEIMRKLRDTSIKSLDVQVQFFDRQAKKTAWFVGKTQNICWETWKLHLSVLKSSTYSFTTPNSVGGIPSEDPSRKETSKELQRALLEVVSEADNHKEHIPPITTTDVAPFPFEISIS